MVSQRRLGQRVWWWMLTSDTPALSPGRSDTLATLSHAVGKRHLFLSFPYVCPEPVLAKRSFLYINGSKMPYFAGTRFILVLFCYVEGFAYGELVNDYVAKHGCDGRPALARVTLSAADMCRLVRASQEQTRKDRRIAAC